MSDSTDRNIRAGVNGRWHAALENLDGEPPGPIRDHILIYAERVRAAVLAEVRSLAPPNPTVAEDGMVHHQGGFSHTPSVQCDQCPNFPHNSCVSAVSLAAAAAIERYFPEAERAAPLP
jgi:hypothetical protein